MYTVYLLWSLHLFFDWAIGDLLTLQSLQIKCGDIRVLAHVSLFLVKKECSSEIRLHAFKMLQVLVLEYHFCYPIN